MATIVDRKKQLEKLSKQGQVKIVEKSGLSKALYKIDIELKDYKKELAKRERESESNASKILLSF